MADDCIFCRIAIGEIPCSKVFENDRFLAFLDISPAVKGHTLVIPKKHYETLLDISQDELKEMSVIVQNIARAVDRSLKAEGINILQNNRKVAGQEIPHLHIHIIPRKTGDGNVFEWKHMKYEDNEMNLFLAKIKKEIK